MALNEIPQITWGTSFANTLSFGYPLSLTRAWTADREGSEYAKGASGAQDAWITGTDAFLRGDWTWIPPSDGTDPVATGWDGATGVDAFLAWARQGNAFRFYPNKDVGTYIECYLVSPEGGRPPDTPEDGWHHILGFTIRSVSGSAFTGY